MKRKVKVAQIGCGKMSTYLMRYVMEKGGEIVSAFDNDSKKIGKDVGIFLGLEKNGIEITNINMLEEMFRANKPDIAIVATMSLLNDLENVIRSCIKCGVNVITTCEEAFYASNSNPYLFKELDTLAKSNNVTITGCGYQDVFWGELVSSLASSTHKITKIKGSSSYNVEDYGIALAKAHGAGFTEEEFDAEIKSASEMSENERKKMMEQRTFAPSYMWNVVGWLGNKLGLHITNINQECIPMFAKKDIHSNTLNMDLKIGDITGMDAIVKADTEEGISLEVECIGKVYDDEEFDTNNWTIIGEPETNMINNKPDTVSLTCADIVNRIPDVINAKPGFISTSEMPNLSYRIKNLNEYIEKE